MTTLQIVVLAILQGITEFLPISSSAHMIMVPLATGWPDQGLAFDVALHVGTLSAVIGYFRRELIVMAKDWGVSCVQRRHTGESRLAWAVLLGTVPLGIAGLLFHEAVETVLRSPLVIAWATIGFGILLWWSDVFARRMKPRSEHQLTWKDIVVIGIAQALALIPGTSRSGITMTAGLFLGLSRSAAARFSFLLSIPSIVMAGGYKGLQLIESDGVVAWSHLLLGVILSAVTAYLVIHAFFKVLERMGMQPFVWYRLLLGGVLLYLFS